MKDLKVFRGLPIPGDYASTETYALLAKRNGGKTYTTLKFEEQMCDAGLFFVTLDPVGKHWALRAGVDGKHEDGKDVWVLGGAHGDVPLDASSGELIADTVVSHPGRYVLDVSGFETDAEQDRFALAFGKRLFRRKMHSPGFPLMLVLEEAESFIPERPAPGQAPMLGAYGRIMRQGRNHGLGMWMVAQRAQALNKGVLSQAEVLVVKQMAHERDRKAVDKWIEANGTPEQREELMGSLASLEQNEAWVWSPSWMRVFQKAPVMTRVTFDSSASVKAGEKQQAVNLTPLDVDALGDQIEKLAERAKAEDPRHLQKQVADLKKEITGLQSELESRPDAEPERVEVPVLRDEDVRTLQEVADELRLAGSSVAEEVGKALQPVGPAADSIAAAAKSATGARAQPRVDPAPARAPRPRPEPTPRPAPRVDPGSNGRVTGPQQRIIDALGSLEAIHAARPRRTQVALFAQASPTSSGFEKNLSTLRTSGLIDYPEQGRVCLTAEGRKFAEGIAPATIDELHEFAASLLKPAKWRLVKELIECYPDAITREQLADWADASPTSSGFEKNLSTLRSLGLIDYPQRGMVAATPILFLEPS